MDKEKIALLKSIPKVLRQLNTEIEKLASELAAAKRKDLAEEIVEQMEDKGLGDPAIPFKKKVAALLGSDKNLDQIREAIKLTGSRLNFGKVTEESSGSTNSGFEDYIMGS